jgi:hypothetical protein
LRLGLAERTFTHERDHERCEYPGQPRTLHIGIKCDLPASARQNEELKQANRGLLSTHEPLSHR